jgi:hypothetical protein
MQRPTANKRPLGSRLLASLSNLCWHIFLLQQFIGGSGCHLQEHNPNYCVLVTLYSTDARIAFFVLWQTKEPLTGALKFCSSSVIGLVLDLHRNWLMNRFRQQIYSCRWKNQQKGEASNWSGSIWQCYSPWQVSSLHCWNQFSSRNTFLSQLNKENNIGTLPYY